MFGMFFHIFQQLKSRKKPQVSSKSKNLRLFVYLIGGLLNPIPQRIACDKSIFFETLSKTACDIPLGIP